MQAFSHDEVVHGKGSLVNKMNLAYQEDRIANLHFSPCSGFQVKKLSLWGVKLQWAEWDFESLDWALLDYPLHNGVRKMVSD